MRTAGSFSGKGGTVLGSSVVLKSTGLLAQAGSGPNQQEGSEDAGEGGVHATEDLMREYGVLSRIPLIRGESSIVCGEGKDFLSPRYLRRQGWFAGL